eukprot:9671-Heterococcus_DN1.PRE.3
MTQTTTANACKFTITGGITLHISIKYAPLSLPHFMPAHSGDPHNNGQQQHHQHHNNHHTHHNSIGGGHNALNNSSNTNAADLSANANGSNPMHSNSHNTTATPTFTPGSLLGSFLDPVAAQNTPMLLFEVKDTGVGIPDDNKGALFQAFGQTQKFQSQGTGLG